ncbi:hypothetical protein B0T13DRAFT_12888 [Neurospora crassa]|nr:hypothetical protein B0T13DRAFT_12888 [Neurospora crassa]
MSIHPHQRPVPLWFIVLSVTEQAEEAFAVVGQRTEGDGLPLRRVPGCLTTITAGLGKPISLLGKLRSYGDVKNGRHSGRIRNTRDMFCQGKAAISNNA